MRVDRVRFQVGCVALAAAATTVSCAGKTERVSPPTVSAGSHPASSPSTSPPATPTATPTSGSAALAATLTRRQLAGQRVVYSYRGRTPPAALLTHIRRGEAAGVMFFKDNIASRAQIRATIATLQRANAKSPVRAPLLMMTDQEGGTVRRLPGAPDLSAKQVGNAPDPLAAARRSGTGAGRNLREVGMNVNLAPVLDVYRTPGDFADRFQRSFGSDPAKVGALGAAFVKAQQGTGVAATAKHFPGLGTAATKENTDLGTVTLNVPVRTLRAVDELPYRAAIGAGVKLIMMSWARYPALDPDRPAGLSPTIVRSELRQRYGFEGVTITDALEAKGLSAFGSTSHRGVLAAGAGMDLLLYSGMNVDEGTNGLNALVSAVRSGKLNSKTHSAAAQRVMDLRTGLRP